MIRVSSGRVELVPEHRPPMIAISFGEPNEARTFGLEPAAAFELAHSMAMCALALEPALETILRSRLEEARGIWTP